MRPAGTMESLPMNPIGLFRREAGSWKVPCSLRTCSSAMNPPWRRSASRPIARPRFGSQRSTKPRVWAGSALVPKSALRFGTNRAPTAPLAFLGSQGVLCSFRTCSRAMNRAIGAPGSDPARSCGLTPTRRTGDRRSGRLMEKGNGAWLIKRLPGPAADFEKFEWKSS
jgi:hypothetical protein